MDAVFTCPWCGTNYLAYQTNCSNCGGPMLAPRQGSSLTADEGALPVPPPAPRSISPRYIWKLLGSDAWSIVAMIFGILGVVFTVVGSVLTVVVITAFVGIPFVVGGLLALAFSASIFAWRYRMARRVLQVLREGEVTEGQVTAADEQTAVSVNGRHPWIVRYEFALGGSSYKGKVTTLNPPGSHMASGKPVRVLYMPGAPECNSIYPHP